MANSVSTVVEHFSHEPKVEGSSKATGAGGEKKGQKLYDRKEPKSCLSQVFNSMFGSIGILHGECMERIQLCLELNTRPRCCPVS